MVRRLGFEDRAETLEIPENQLVNLKVELSSEPIELDPIVATVRSPVLMRNGFYARETQGYSGTRIERQEIEDRRIDTVTDLFKGMRGVSVVYGGLYGSRVFINQSFNFSTGGRGCIPSVYLDGIRSTMRTYDVMRADEIEGIEVYSRGGVPGKYNDPCGVVLIWTRVPVRAR